ncbi:hypothetical protein ACTID9_02895 [Brevibacillus fluminis]|uniref:hypothetical protein n=1 Tax=Brevibacillus fluminis TaxID=511487 RepID=UPI003F8BDD09
MNRHYLSWAALILVFALLATSVVSASGSANRASAAAKSKIGFLAYWHSMPNDPGERTESARMVAELEKKTGIPGYFVSHMPLATWWDGISYLEAKGVNQFIVIYMDNQPTYGSTLTDVVQWMLDLPGGRAPGKDVPNGWGTVMPSSIDPEKYGDVVSYMGETHYKFKTFSNSVFTFTTTPGDPGDTALDSLENQVREALKANKIKNPAKVSIMLVDHGASVDEVNQRWVDYRQTQADALKERLGLKRAGAFNIREDWPNLWPESVAAIVDTANTWAKDSTVIHVPVREMGRVGGSSTPQILAEFEKAKWKYAPAMLEVEKNKELLTDWAVATIKGAVAQIKKNKPKENGFYGRTAAGVEGGIESVTMNPSDGSANGGTGDGGHHHMDASDEPEEEPLAE